MQENVSSSDFNMDNNRSFSGGEGVTIDGEWSISDDGKASRDDVDAVLDVLANEQRRRILAHLADAPEDVAAFSDLVEHVAGGRAESSPEEREETAIRLRHNHLPKLADAGIVSYDARDETVRYHGGPLVVDWLELARAYESGELDG